MIGRRVGSWRSSWLRSLTGLLAGGLVALALALVASWVIADQYAAPGPGPGMVIWHGTAAVAAVLAQRRADRQPGLPGALAAGAVVAITAVVLGVQWFF